MLLNFHIRKYGSKSNVGAESIFAVRIFCLPRAWFVEVIVHLGRTVKQRPTVASFTDEVFATELVLDNQSLLRTWPAFKLLNTRSTFQ